MTQDSAAPAPSSPTASHPQTRGAERLRDVDYLPPLRKAIPLGIQHVLAMFVANATVPLVIAGAAGLSGADTVFLVQMAMFVAGVATLVQTLGLGPVGARLPIVMGTSFGFVPVMIPIATTQGLPAVFGGALVGGLAMATVGLFYRRLSVFFPPVVSGTFVLLIGLLLLPVGFSYVGGGFGAADFGAPHHLLLAALVFVVTVAFHQFGRGFLSEAAVLIGILVGCVAAAPLGLLDFSGVGEAAWFQLPIPLQMGITFDPTAMLAIALMAVVTCAESIGDISGTAIGGAEREATPRELSGGVMADGLASTFASLFGGFPQISFSQNVGLVAFTGIASRFVVAIGGAFLIVAGLVPKLGATVSAIPAAVLGGAVVIMFGMIASAGVKMLSHATFDKRNMLIVGVSLAVAIGLPAQKGLYAAAPEQIGVLIDSGLIPGAIVSIVLNLVLPGRSSS
ncbi:nucleobase:cation symporter-2 family protein [Salinicola sp. JS01]|uniref:uracil-xanthine permease family protein n=1 Tax=Salinicola sp. JS01 TaxID=3050071 RepID=UPI00255BF7CF|nr:nucleobase:cation symporter-2 family protein [Salinicola sp. JS01]WIX32374.1 nucleobase:cation symporter-2 family protein [Salinicola sp. JS01]